MDQDVDGDGAINLSTSQRPSAATTPNDSVHTEDAEQQAASLEKVLKEQQQHQQLELERGWDQERDAKGNGSTSPSSDHRVQDHTPPPSTDAQKTLGAAIPPVTQSQTPGPQMMSSSASNLHHMQQLLQQHVLNPTQLQTLMKQHSLLQQQQHQQHQLAELGKKQIEQTMQQLQEQLQLNLIQQTHILQSADKKKASGSLQQLALQQQQLIQQLQLMQRQYVVHQGMGMQPLMLAQGQGLNSRDVMSPWKELNEQHVSNAKSDLNGKWDRGGTVERCFIVVTRGFARTAGGCAWPLRQGGSASRGETGEDDDAGPRSSSVRARCLQMAGMRDYLRRPASIHQAFKYRTHVRRPIDCSSSCSNASSISIGASAAKRTRPFTGDDASPPLV
jgi:hypothetical protein